MDLKNIKIEDPFWGHMQELVTDVVIPFQEDVLNDRQPGVEKSHAIENFKIAAGLSQGEFYGMVFQDSDVAKWLEGVAYSLIIKPDAALEKRADDIIDIIAAAQQPDGYLNTYFTIKEPEHRWQNLLECHELYCAGHMMEAAVAYYEATGKDKLLKVMEGMAGHIIDRFGPDKLPGIPGHQEVEIGLMRMYHATGNEAYKKQARYFLEERGKNPAFFAEEAAKRDWNHFGMVPKDIKYNQSHATIYEQEEAVGHSVRAVYMYTAMADLAATEHDEKLFAACERLWNNMTEKKMYITGGIGSTVEGEAFTKEYELPNDMAYAETCASIGLVFFAKQMLKMCGLGKRMRHKPTQMSGGQQQRVAIARALSHGPSIIVADEPTGNLDPATQDDIMGIFRMLAHDEHRCVIIVTHSPEVAKTSDEVFELAPIRRRR